MRKSIIILNCERANGTKWKRCGSMLKPVDWSVVVAGRWNRAILTPAGIRERIHKEAAEVPLMIEVPIDLLAPPKVGFGGVSIVADWNKLVIVPDSPCWALLKKSADLACNALRALPQTPLQAVGINLAFTSRDPLESLNPFIQNPHDPLFSDIGLKAESKTVVRSMLWKSGRVNLTISRRTNVEGEVDADKVGFNLEQTSEKIEDHEKWLLMPFSDIQQITCHSQRRTSQFGNIGW